MGEVYAAVHRGSGLSCAVKLLRPDLAKRPHLVELFLREVRAMARLDHPHVLPVYDAGTHEDGPWCAMERAEVALHQRLPDSWPEALAVLRAVLDALGHAHARGVVHRDVKPENLLYARVAGDLQLRLCDFGIARLNDELVGVKAGTPGYMVPEQVHGSAGPGTDLFAVGVLAYELISGTRPYDGVPAPGAQPRPLLPRGTVPEGVVPWVMRLLAVDPARRPKDVAVARQALEEAAGGRAMGWMRPPLPRRWRDALPSVDADVHRVPTRAGIGLVGVRDVPLVGRDDLRDRLWQMLLDIEASGRAAAVELRVPSGEGASRIGRWLTERAAEAGAVGLYVTAGLGPTDGLHGLSERLEAQGVAAPTEGSVVDQVLGQLHRMCDGPTVLWVDGGPHDLAVVRLVRHLLGSEEPLPVLLLLGTVPDRPWSLGRHALSLEEVPPLPVEQKARALVQGLRIAPDAAEALVTASPTLGAAMERIRTAVALGQVVAGPHGYGLLERAEASVEARLQLSTLSGSALAALQVAALLGAVVDGTTWERACRAAGRARGQAEAEGIARGVLREEVGGRLVFARDGLREALLASLFPAEAERLHVACAEALALDGPGVAGRRGRHLWEANRLEQAFDELMVALDQPYDPEQVAWIELAGACLTRLRPPGSDLRWGRLYSERVQLHLHRHAFPALRDAVDQLLAWMDAHGGWSRAPNLVDPAVRAALSRGRMDDAVRWLTPALAHIEQDPGRLLRLHGLVMQQSGRTDEAIHSFRQALDHWPVGVSPLTVMNDIAVCLETAGRYEEALAMFRACLRLPEGERLVLVRLNIAGTLLELDRAEEADRMYESLHDAVRRTTDMQVQLGWALGRTIAAARVGDDVGFAQRATRVARLLDTVRLRDFGVATSLARHAWWVRQEGRVEVADRLRTLAGSLCRDQAERNALDGVSPMPYGPTSDTNGDPT